MGGIGALLHNLQYDLLWRECRQAVGLASTDLVSLEPVDLLFSKSWCTFLLATDADQVTPKGIAQRYVHELIRPWHSIGESICDGGVVGGVRGKQEERQLSFGHQHPNGLADKQTTWSTHRRNGIRFTHTFIVLLHRKAARQCLCFFLVWNTANAIPGRSCSRLDVGRTTQKHSGRWYLTWPALTHIL